MKEVRANIELSDVNQVFDYSYSESGKEWLRQKARKSDKILEISPGLMPICRKEDFPDLYYIDVYEEDFLKSRASTTPGLDTNMGEDGILKVAKLDMVMGTRTFRQTINDFGLKNANLILASHVFEHIPDPIEFLRVCGNVLNDGAELCMIVPDKRFCFDLYRPVTTFGEWYEAFAEERTINSLRSRVDVAFYNASLDNRGAWPRSEFARATLNPITASKPLKDTLKSYLDAKEYFDCHASVMTPESIHLNLIECFLLDLIELHVEEVKSFDNDIGLVLRKKVSNKKDSILLDRLHWLRIALLRNLYQNEQNYFK